MNSIDLKTDRELDIMKEGGDILNTVMEKLLHEVQEGVSLIELDKMAEEEIVKRGGSPSFKTVPGYRWSICTCVNEEVVHGIPTGYKLKNGDIIGIDLGVYFKGFHTDSSWTIPVGNKVDKSVADFLKTGRIALDRAIEKVKIDNYIYDISQAIEDTVTKAGYSVVKSLIGHGIGRHLHERPEIPGFVRGKRVETVKIAKGQALAIEVIYNMGSGEVVYQGTDGWTIKSEDDKISGLFETTVGVQSHGVVLLTKKYGSSGIN